MKLKQRMVSIPTKKRVVDSVKHLVINIFRLSYVVVEDVYVSMMYARKYSHNSWI